MDARKARIMSRRRRGDSRSGTHLLAVITSIVVVQAAATAFFLGDAVLDIALGVQVTGAFYHGFELLVAIALSAGVVMGVLVLRRLITEAKQRDRTVALARGAMAAPRIEVEALFPEAAVVKVDGQRKMLRVGDAFQGVTLLAAGSASATLEVNGQQQVHGLTRSVR